MIRPLALCLALTTPAFAEDRALVIGIDDYSAGASRQMLRGAVTDAQRFAAFLVSDWDYSENQVVTLANPTSEQLLSTLIDTLVGGTQPGDRAVLYFAGLGKTLPDGKPALIGRDAHALLGQIPLDVITDMIALMPGRDVTLILDTSFDGDPDLIGGALTRGAPGATNADDIADVGTVWRATDAGQFAWETIDQGVFTQSFISGVQTGQADADNDGQITNAELLAHVRSDAARWCAATNACAATGRGLTPQMRGAPDTVIGTVAGAVTPSAPPPPTAAIMPDDGAPATYRETLGFVTDLFAPSNDAGLHLAMSDTPRVGGTVQFSVTTNRPGAVLLLDVDPTGALAQVFPSALAPRGSTQITPDAPLVIPNGTGPNGQSLVLRVSEPAGQGFLLALFVEGDLPTLTALMPTQLSGGPVANASQYLYEISQDLLALQADPDTAIAWSATYLPYRITP